MISITGLLGVIPMKKASEVILTAVTGKLSNLSGLTKWCYYYFFKLSIPKLAGINQLGIPK